MEKNDNVAIAAIIGGFAGAVLAAPSAKDKQELSEYRQIKQQFQNRISAVGHLSFLTQTGVHEDVRTVFVDSYRMYLSGFFRASAVFSVAAIEGLLRKQFGKKKLNELIERGKTQGILTESEYHFLHGLRLERNQYIHETNKPVMEKDTIHMLRLADRIANAMTSKHGLQGL